VKTQAAGCYRRSAIDSSRCRLHPPVVSISRSSPRPALSVSRSTLNLARRNLSISTSQEPLSAQFATNQRKKHDPEKEEGLSTFSVGSLKDLVMNRIILVSWQICG
jgi:hypothetical protein